jgi:hypothetical protein
VSVSVEKKLSVSVTIKVLHNIPSNIPIPPNISPMGVPTSLVVILVQMTLRLIFKYSSFPNTFSKKIANNQITLYCYQLASHGDLIE